MLFCVGLYAVAVKRNLIKVIIGLSIMGYAVNLFLVLTGYRHNATYPFLTKEAVAAAKTGVNVVDPLPQAMVLIAIMIGLAITLILVSISIRLYEKHGTLDITEIRKLRG